MTLKITKDTFEQEVLQSDLPVLVDFWAAWCGPCKMVGPVIDELAAEVTGKAKIAKVNVDEEPDLARKYGVMSIPTMVVFRGGKEVERIVGVRDKGALLALLGL